MQHETEKKVNKNIVVVYFGFDGTRRFIPRPKDFQSYMRNIEITKKFVLRVRNALKENYLDSRMINCLDKAPAEIWAQNLYFQREDELRANASSLPVKIGGLSMYIADSIKKDRGGMFSVNFSPAIGMSNEKKELFESLLMHFPESLDSNDLDEDVKRMEALINLKPENFLKVLKRFSSRFKVSDSSWKKEFENEFSGLGKPLLFLCDRHVDGAFFDGGEHRAVEGYFDDLKEDRKKRELSGCFS